MDGLQRQRLSKRSDSKSAPENQHSVFVGEYRSRSSRKLLHPLLFDETGLASAIGWYVEKVTRRSGITVSLQLPDTIQRFSDEVETTVFRIFEESLTNAHGQAKTERGTLLNGRS